MVENNSFVKKIIDSSVSFFNSGTNLIWHYKKAENNIIQYYTKYYITEKKYFYLLLTKRKIGGGKSNIYLEVYFTSKKKGFSSDLDVKPDLPDYHYRHIRSIYVSSWPMLVKLYAIVKYDNHLKNFVGKEKYVKQLKDWTKDGYLAWEKHTLGYICYDLKNHFGCDIYLNSRKNDKVSIQLDGKLYHKINDMDGDGLYNIIDQSVKKKLGI